MILQAPFWQARSLPDGRGVEDRRCLSLTASESLAALQNDASLLSADSSNGLSLLFNFYALKPNRRLSH